MFKKAQPTHAEASGIEEGYIKEESQKKARLSLGEVGRWVDDGIRTHDLLNHNQAF